MTAQQLAERLHARPSHVGWVARCPGPMHKYGDRSPSLSIHEGEGGRVLVNCFTGCPPEKIVGALNLRMCDLFPNWSRKPDPPEVRAAKRRAAEAIADMRGRLTPTDRERPITIIETDREGVDLAIARALALAVESRELVQIVLVEERT